MVPEYRAWLSKIGVKSVRIQEDGSIDFTMGGFGGAIMSDSYIGIRFSPALPSANRPGWNPIVVKSLNDSALPQEHGRVASGYYVVPIEPNWYVYRFEYLE
jgi:hypothetical protein